MRAFQLFRVYGGKGNTGTLLAEGVVFTSGQVAINYLDRWGAICLYSSVSLMTDALNAQPDGLGRAGETSILWLDGSTTG